MVLHIQSVFTLILLLVLLPQKVLHVRHFYNTNQLVGRRVSVSICRSYVCVLFDSSLKPKSVIVIIIDP